MGESRVVVNMYQIIYGASRNRDRADRTRYVYVFGLTLKPNSGAAIMNHISSHYIEALSSLSLFRLLSFLRFGLNNEQSANAFIRGSLVYTNNNTAFGTFAQNSKAAARKTIHVLETVCVKFTNVRVFRAEGAFI